MTDVRLVEATYEFPPVETIDNRGSRVIIDAVKVKVNSAIHHPLWYGHGVLPDGKKISSTTLVVLTRCQSAALLERLGISNTFQPNESR